ncbi:MAG: LTA synthase family protein [Sedimentibacter sp.]|uniref:LTA synthase family protein n=1 Tax=Sedimentibacter sp. TaxID=1960295 RepID=UPI003158A422
MKKITISSFFWFLVFFFIIIKSSFLLFDLYSYNLDIIISFSLYGCTPTLLLVSFSFVLKGKKQYLYLILIDFVISLLFFVDIIYARAFGKLISIYMIFSEGVLIDLEQSIVSLIKVADFLYFIDLPFLLLLYNKKTYRNISIRKVIMFIVTFTACIITIVAQFNQLEDTRMIGNIRMHPLILSPIGKHMYDILSVFYEKNYTLDEQDKNAISYWLNENFKHNTPDIKYQYFEGIASGKNIIAIQFESLENIVINRLYFNQEITPNINKLLKSSIYFSNIYEQVNEGNSSDAELMFNTSIYPIKNGSTFIRFGNNRYYSLPYMLSLEGYTSIAVHGDDKEFWNRNRVFPSLGFNNYISEEQFVYKKIDGMGIADESLFLQSFDELQKLKSPFYMFIITLTSHMPFNISDEIKYLNLPYNDYSCNYLQSIHYTDKALGEFYSMLKDNGYLENSILVIYGDHEGIHKYYDTYLPENNKKIPYIIYIPGIEGFEIDNIGGQVDMMPTLSYLLGLDKIENTKFMMGKNLFSKTSSALFSSGEIIGKTYDATHLTSANYIADLIIRGDFFKEILK